LLLAFTAQRVAEVTGAEWAEFDLKMGIWSIPRSRMKRKDEERGPHIAPIPPYLLEQMREWRAVDGKAATMVCVAPRDPSRSITPEGVEKFYRDARGLGGKHSPHSWRSAFSTVCREAGKDGDQIEGQLDHAVGKKVSVANDRAKRVALRMKLMEWYEKQLIAARVRAG
jgi:integrase